MKKLLIIFIIVLTLAACKKPEIDFEPTDQTFVYSIQSSFDLKIQDLPNDLSVTEVKRGQEMLTSAIFIHDKSELFLKSSYLKGLSLGEHVLSFETEKGIFSIRLNIIDTNRPYMISSSTVFTDFSKDVIVLFELFGGSIQSVSGNDITSSHYSIRNNQLTIKKGFIEQSFTQNPDRETLIIGYTLHVDSHVVIGYLFIKKATT